MCFDIQHYLFRFGMLQFHTKVAEVFGQRSNDFSTVFSLMTTKVVTESTPTLYKTVSIWLRINFTK